MTDWGWTTAAHTVAPLLGPPPMPHPARAASRCVQSTNETARGIPHPLPETMHDTTTTNTTTAQAAPHAFTLNNSMRRNGRLRPPPPTVTFTGEGENEKAIVSYCGFSFLTEAAWWRRLYARFNGDVPPFYSRTNGRGRRYLGMTLPRRPGEPKGKDVMLARELTGAKPGRQLCYRDGNPLNLTRENLRDMRRKDVAEGKAR